VALLAWALGGAIALAGSLSLAELGAMFPRAGSVYVFLYEAYGPAIAFLKGWVYLLIGPSAWAALALIFAEYARNFLPMSEMGVHLLAVVLIAMLAAIGCRSVSLAAWVQTISTWAKVTALLGMALAMFFLGRNNLGQVGIGAEHWHGLSGLGLALVPVMFAYDGWNGFTAMSGEVRDPGRTIPLSLTIGVLADFAGGARCPGILGEADRASCSRQLSSSSHAPLGVPRRAPRNRPRGEPRTPIADTHM
jgi:APA family basic amino acid/polyamine antiporter